MSEKKPFPFRVFGCGCGCIFFLIAILTAFIFGARYGKELVDKTSDRFSYLWEDVKNEIDATKEDASNSIDKANEDLNNAVDGINKSVPTVDTNEYNN